MARPRCSSKSSTSLALAHFARPPSARRGFLQAHIACAGATQALPGPRRAGRCRIRPEAPQRRRSSPAARNVSAVPTTGRPPPRSSGQRRARRCGSVAVAIAASNTAPYESSQAATSSPKDGHRSPGLVVTPRAPGARKWPPAASDLAAPAGCTGRLGHRSTTRS